MPRLVMKSQKKIVGESGSVCITIIKRLNSFEDFATTHDCQLDLDVSIDFTVSFRGIEVCGVLYEKKFLTEFLANIDGAIQSVPRKHLKVDGSSVSLLIRTAYSLFDLLEETVPDD